MTFERDTSTGMLYHTTTTKLSDEKFGGTGSIVGMSHSNTTLVVSMAATDAADSRVVVLDLACGWTPSPTDAPSPAPQGDGGAFVFILSQNET